MTITTEIIRLFIGIICIFGLFTMSIAMIHNHYKEKTVSALKYLLMFAFVVLVHATMFTFLIEVIKNA